MAATASRTSVKAVTSRTGSVACSLRACRNVSNPVRPGIRTSEIIMSNFPARSVSNAVVPESARTVSNFWLRKNEFSKLRWPGSSSTMRMRGDSADFLRGSAAMREVCVGILRQATSFKWVMRKTAPLGSFGRHSISQPWARTICCTTARPRPVPFWCVVK